MTCSWGGPPVCVPPPKQPCGVCLSQPGAMWRGVKWRGRGPRLTRPRLSWREALCTAPRRLLPPASGKPIHGICFDFFTSFVAYFNIFDLLRRRAGGTKNVLELFAGAAAPGRLWGPAERQELKFLRGVRGRWAGLPPSGAGSLLLCVRVGETGQPPAPDALAAAACRPRRGLAEVVLGSCGPLGRV